MNYKLLMKIKQRPEMYLGKKSITLLHIFLGGYDLCYYEHFGPANDLEQFQQFEEFVRLKYNASKSYYNWAGNILNNSTSEEEAFDRFFELLEEFSNLNCN